MNAPAVMVPPFRFTRHAVDRFITRVWPTIGERPIADDREALAILCAASRDVEAMPRRSILGDAIWSVREPAMRWISKPGDFRGRRVAVVVTVLAGADDAADEERAEREVVDAARRLADVPELGREEPTTPAPGPLEGFALKAYRAWIQVETQRLSVERARIAMAQNHITAARHEATRRERTARHMATQAHEALFCELLARLAEVDPVGSAELLEQARERVAKWEREGRLTDGDRR